VPSEHGDEDEQKGGVHSWTDTADTP